MSLSPYIFVTFISSILFSVIFWNKGVSDTDPNNVIKNMIYHHIHNICDALVTYTPEMIENFKKAGCMLFK